jgi:DNA helicase-2/ATP-dependent DNA helicase PcrA
VVLALPEDMLHADVDVADARPYAGVQPHPGPDEVGRLRELLAGAEAPDLATWLADLQLDEAEAAATDDRAVPLLTIHSSKGREWPVVFIAGWEEGLMPFGRAPSGPDEAAADEERRLAYVALSRSQVQVYLTWCRSRWRGREGRDGRRELRQPSRYLRALPPELVHPAARAQAGRLS